MRAKMGASGTKRRWYGVADSQTGISGAVRAIVRWIETIGRLCCAEVAERGMGLVLDNLLIFLVVGLALAACLVTPFIMLVMMRHKDRVELDQYGKYRGSGPAKSFVCPECLTRTYAPSHIARRWCARCEKSFPEKKPSGTKNKVWQPEAQAAE